MRYLGLDLGSRTCGIAMSDSFGMIASTYETFRFNDDEYLLAAEHIANIVLKEKIGKVILGYPKHMNNDVGLRALISEEFKIKLESLVSIPIILWDERMTTMEVNRIMLQANTRRDKRKEKKDELAAVVILQSYLDCRKGD